MFLTFSIYQSYNRCDTMRLKWIPRDKDTSLFCLFSVLKKKIFCFLLNVFLINKPLFTWIPQLIACISFICFCLVLCFCIKLEFLIFLHCNCNTSLFDLFFLFLEVFLVLPFISHQAVEKDCVRHLSSLLYSRLIVNFGGVVCFMQAEIVVSAQKAQIK